MLIDTNFSFTSDTPNYWDGYWEINGGLGCGKKDPDSDSKTANTYHRLLWSKELPNGEFMKLERGAGGTLRWGEMYFSSDSITTGFRYHKYKQMLDKVAERVPDYKAFVEKYVYDFYTIGGMIIFPVMRNSINQMRGTNARISDRWDLTLECIRRYYSGEESPLQNVLERNKFFFDLFVDFKGYVDFFLLQDCVDSKYETVNMWTDVNPFIDKALPRSVDEYFNWINKEYEFVNKRNKRIEEYAKTH